MIEDTDLISSIMITQCSKLNKIKQKKQYITNTQSVYLANSKRTEKNIYFSFFNFVSLILIEISIKKCNYVINPRFLTKLKVSGLPMPIQSKYVHIRKQDDIFIT